MLRISIVIAHQNDQRLEDTLLSVLENRPRDCEIIVAHDGSYTDPYQLADEVLFVETDHHSSRIAKFNEGLYAACAPVVHLLSEGTTVTEGWCDGPVQQILRNHSVAVAPLIQSRDNASIHFAGLSEEGVSRRAVQTVRGNHVSEKAPVNCAGPTLAGGFYSRRLLLGLGGLLETVDTSIADLDLALSLAGLELECDVDASSVIIGDTQLVGWRRDAAASRDLAALLVAHRVAPAGMIAGMKAIAQRFLGNLLNPGQWPAAIAFGMGLTTHKLDTQVSDRLQAWKRTQTALQASSSQATRRAA